MTDKRVEKVIELLGKSARWLWRATILMTVVLFVLALFLVFGSVPVPVSLVERWAAESLPPSMVLDIRSISVGLRHGVEIESFRLYKRDCREPLLPLLSFESATLHPFARTLEVVDLRCPRLHDGYYEPGNLERNERVEVELPDLGSFHLTLVAPKVLGVCPERVEADVVVVPQRASIRQGRLYWPDSDVKLTVDGECTVDFAAQRVRGGARGRARQAHVRPMLVALDLPVTLPYFDAFTDVPEPVEASCTWDVNLVNNDLDLLLEMNPVLGKYNGVAMRGAKGTIRVQPYTRGTCLNYHTVIGPVAAQDAKGRPLEGSVDIVGTNYFNTVTVDAKSSLPIADLIRVAGFTGDYVNADAYGDVTGRIQLRFPRSMTNNYEVLDGEGRFRSENGRLQRMRLFAGLTRLLAERVPGMSSVVDQTVCSGSFRIEGGVVKTEDLLLEGDVFSICMNGNFDATRDRLDFTVRVTLFRNDSILSQLASPLTWTFSKLLLEFRLTGSAEEPKWEYVSVIDRILEVTK